MRPTWKPNPEYFNLEKDLINIFIFTYNCNWKQPIHVSENLVDSVIYYGNIESDDNIFNQVHYILILYLHLFPIIIITIITHYLCVRSISD